MTVTTDTAAEFPDRLVNLLHGQDSMSLVVVITLAQRRISIVQKPDRAGDIVCVNTRGESESQQKRREQSRKAEKYVFGHADNIAKRPAFVKGSASNPCTPGAGRWRVAVHQTVSATTDITNNRRRIVPRPF